MNFEQQVQQWVAIDNQLKRLNEQTKQLREKRATISNSITSYAVNHGISSSGIKISDGTLKIVSTRVPEQLTFKYLDKKFENLEQSKWKYYDIVFKYPGEDYGTLGWEKSGSLWIYYKLINNISSFIPIEKPEIQKIIGRYVEDRYNLKVTNTGLLSI